MRTRQTDALVTTRVEATTTDMKTFYVIWTYIGNYSEVKPVQAESSEKAVEVATSFFSKDFQQKGTVYVFDRAPVFTKLPE